SAKVKLFIILTQVYYYAPLKLRVCKKGAVKLMLQTAPSIECISLFFNILQRYTFAIAAPS
ncbi:hypothetical protein, partial [uncultured Duncaniella sp.]|uniref:hypothetical protein n=1 Tax=uncultured Duncaniella sp. TaxID=2768039 RepID=UPI0026771486